ncbi:hypothetical protein Tco_0797660 [Tanacetum coccineum]
MHQNQDSSILTKRSDKGKAIATEEDPRKELIPLLEESGSSPKVSDLKSFNSDRGQMTFEKAKAQIEELRRIELLKAEKEKSEKELLKLLNPTTVKAQKLKLAEYEAKKSKMIREYNDYITKRLDPLPITKISYTISKRTKEATMRITRVHALASKGKSQSNIYLFKSLKAKFQWVLTQARKLGLPLPFELSTYKLNPAGRKIKRDSDWIEEMFVKEDIKVDGMQRNLIPPQGVVGSPGLVITKPEAGIFYYNENFDLVFQRENEFHLATTAQLIRQLKNIKRDTLEGKEMVKKL